MFVVIAKQRIKADKKEMFIEAVKKMAPQTRQYPGCISYELTQSRDDENVFLFKEVWDNDVDFAGHFEADFTKEFEAILPEVADGDVEPYVCDIIV